MYTRKILASMNFSPTFQLTCPSLTVTNSKNFGRLKMTPSASVGAIYRQTLLHGLTPAAPPATTDRWYSTGRVTARYRSTPSTTVVYVEQTRATFWA